MGMDSKTTIQQLGGNRIFAMAFDAKRSNCSADRLKLAVARGLKATNGIKCVTIELAADDTYTVTGYKVKGIDHTAVATETGVYCDSLKRTIETMTGLYLSL